VHAFRHTRTDELLRAGVAEGDVMAVQGWRDRAMIEYECMRCGAIDEVVLKIFRQENPWITAEVYDDD
jgi:integrase